MLPIISQEIYFQITSVPQVSTLDGLCPFWIRFSNVLLQVNVAIDYILQKQELAYTNGREVLRS